MMIVGSQFTHGAARVAALGFGHTAAYLVGAIVLGIGCARRTGRSIVPRLLPIAIAIAVRHRVRRRGSRCARSTRSGRPATVACLARRRRRRHRRLRAGRAPLVAHARR